MATRLLDQLRSSMVNENMDPESLDKTKKSIALLEALDKYRQKNDFSVGDFVRFKEGMRCRSFPKDDEVAIVTGVFYEPVFDPSRKSSGSPFFREPLTIRVGLLTNEIFEEFFMDGSRMEIVPRSAMDNSLLSLADKLTDLFTRLTEPQERLKPGDFVRLKKGLKNTKRPDYGQQCVVMEAFPPFYSDKRGSSSSGFRAPNDVRIGFLDEDGDMSIYMFDSRRFERIPESELK